MALPAHLEVREIEIYPEEDYSDMVCIGKEETDELEYEPAKLYIKRYIRYKYAPKNKKGVFVGQLPARVIEKGIPGAGFLAWILICKYVDHLPLYRQLQRFKRESIPIAASTLVGWVRQSLELLDILFQHLLKDTGQRDTCRPMRLLSKLWIKTKRAPPIKGITGYTIVL